MKYKLRNTPALILLLMLLLTGLVSYAQEHSCKAKLRANRHKTMAYKSKKRSITTWQYKGTTYQKYYREGIDSIVVAQEGFSTSFPLYADRQIATPLIRYKEKGEIFTDSLDLQRKGRHHTYFDMYMSSHVVMTRNDAQNSRLYYGRNGADSLLIVQYSNGMTQQMVWYGQNGEDSVAMTWTGSGILNSIKKPSATILYTDEGILTSSVHDTTIAHHTITCRKEYYSNGILRSVAYYQGDVPCYNWQYYTAKGILEKTDRKLPLSRLQPVVTVVEAPPVPYVFSFVDQYPEYPGGEDAFKQYMDEHLRDVMCRSDKALRGVYKIWMRLAENGQATMQDVQGQNADALVAGLSKMVSGMPTWRAGKMNGMLTADVFVLSVWVE